MALFVVAEGYGEAQALPALVSRLASRLELTLPPIPRSRAFRHALTTKESFERVCAQLGARGETEAVLFTRDADDDLDCPSHRAPEIATWVRDLDLAFPAAIVMFRREYETMFLAAMDCLAGRALRDPLGVERPGLVAGAAYHGDPEHKRDAKGWLSDHMPRGRAYKPTTDQLALTKLLDLSHPRLAALPSFRRLENALRFLSANLGSAGAVYPPPARSAG